MRDNFVLLSSVWRMTVWQVPWVSSERWVADPWSVLCHCVSVQAWLICRWVAAAVTLFLSSHFYQTSLLSTLPHPLFYSFSPSSACCPPPCFLALSPFSSGPGLSWPCPPRVIYHGPGGEPLGLQAPVSPCNRLFVASSKQVLDQQKSIKAWWAFLSQLGSGHWAALRAAPRALCVAAVRWHRSPQD